MEGKRGLEPASPDEKLGSGRVQVAPNLAWQVREGIGQGESYCKSTGTSAEHTCGRQRGRHSAKPVFRHWAVWAVGVGRVG